MALVLEVALAAVGKRSRHGHTSLPGVEKQGKSRFFRLLKGKEVNQSKKKNIKNCALLTAGKGHGILMRCN